jgi:hypothetical protein
VLFSEAKSMEIDDNFPCSLAAFPCTDLKYALRGRKKVSQQPTTKEEEEAEKNVKYGLVYCYCRLDYKRKRPAKRATVLITAF